MEDKNAQVRKIKDKVRLLKSEYNNLVKENIELKAQNTQMINQLMDQDKKIDEIQNKNINLQLSRALGKGIAEADLKQRLDEYIGEIEATIAQLKD
jgi:predicted nuclease with TOPRIM domain